MLLTLALTIILLYAPSTAWAYVDPGFGGYLINSIVSLVATGFAFLSAAVIYFFRTIIGQRLALLWQKHERLCLIIILSVLGLGSFFLGKFLHRAFHDLSTHYFHSPSTRVIDPQDISKGYNLNNGDLFDEKGRIIKQWSNKFLGIIDTHGDYYAEQKDKAPLWGRYSWDDHVIWEKHFPIHHELYLGPQGTIFTFTKEMHDYNNLKVNFDIILEFDKNGKELQRYSFWDHLKEFQPYHQRFQIDVAFPGIVLPLMALWQNTFHGKTYDYFHLNSFFMVPPNALENKNPAFRPGNWLISLLHGSMILILDQGTKKILWHAMTDQIEGGFDSQHSVSMLPDGDILLFNNGDNRKASRILIIDPLTLKIKWQYSHMDFYSSWGGFVQLLPNGNFLITESKKDHVFELTPDKRIVWEYFGTTPKDGDIYRMTRYPKNMIDELLRKNGGQ